jgi:hypothetical protein
MGRIHIDKMMGGRVRDKDEAVTGDGTTPPGGFDTWEEYLAWLIDNYYPLPDGFNTWQEFIDWLTSNNFNVPDEFNTWEEYIQHLIEQNFPLPDEFTTWEEFIQYLIDQTSNPPDGYTTWEEFFQSMFEQYFPLPNEFNTWQEFIDWLTQNTTTNPPDGYTTWEEYFQSLFEQYFPLPNEFNTWQEFIDWLEQNIAVPDTYTTWEEYFETIINELTQLPDQFTTWEEFITWVENNTVTVPDGFDTWEEFIQNLFEQYFPLPDGFTTWEEFIQWLIDNTVTVPDGYTTWEEYFQSLFEQYFPLPNEFTTWEEFIQWLIDNSLNPPDGYTTWEEYFTELIEQTILPDEFTTWEEFITWLTENTVIDPPDEFTTWEEYHEWITNNINQLPDEFNTWEDYIEYIVENYLNDHSTRLISGTVTWIENLDFQVSYLEYQILGQRISSPGGLITIAANTDENPRFAVIYADIYGNIGYILGDSAPAPAVPIVNDTTQIHLTTIYIPALGTEPGTDPGGETPEIVTEIIYDENTEWQTAKIEDTGVTVDFDALTDPQTGVKHIKTDFAAIAGSTWVQAADPISAGVGLALNKFNLPGGEPFEIAFKQPSATFSDDPGILRGVINYSLPQYNKWSVDAWDIDRSYDPVTGRVYYKKYTFNISEVVTKTFEVPQFGLTFEVIEKIILDNQYDELPNKLAFNVTGDVVKHYRIYYDKITVEGEPETGAAFVPQNTALSFTRSEPISAKDGVIMFWMKISAPLLSNSAFLLELYNGTTKTGSLVINSSNMYGFNPNLTSSYQKITIPVADFHLTIPEIDKLIIRPANSFQNNSSVQFDYIVLQTGLIEDIETDRYVESAEFDNENKKLVLHRTAGLPALEIPIPIPDPGTDNYVDAAGVDETAKITLQRTGELPNLEVQLKTMALKTFWTGSQAAYDAIVTKDPNTIYHIEEDPQP